MTRIVDYQKVTDGGRDGDGWSSGFKDSNGGNTGTYTSQIKGEHSPLYSINQKTRT